MSRRQQRMEVATASAGCDRPFTPLSLGTLSLIIKNSAPINRSVWLSLAHLRHRLPETLCQRLLPRALATTDAVPAGFLKWFQSRCQTQQSSQPQSSVAAHSVTTSVPPAENLEQLWAALADKPLLDGTDLALLSLYHDELSLEPSPLW